MDSEIIFLGSPTCFQCTVPAGVAFFTFNGTRVDELNNTLKVKYGNLQGKHRTDPAGLLFELCIDNATACSNNAHIECVHIDDLASYADCNTTYCCAGAHLKVQGLYDNYNSSQLSRAYII